MSGPCQRNAGASMSAATARLKEFDMQWFLWTLAAWIAWGVLAVVAAVGKPRKPITGGTAALNALINGAAVVGLVVAALRVSHA